MKELSNWSKVTEHRNGRNLIAALSRTLSSDFLDDKKQMYLFFSFGDNVLLYATVGLGPEILRPLLG